MGNKKPTKSERRDEAKQRRLEEMRRRQRKARQRKIVTWVAVLVVIAGAGVGIFLAASNKGKSKEELNKLAAAAGCSNLQTPADQGQTHITPPQTFNFNTTPPTSGNHYGSPDQTGVHVAQIPNEVQVHNLEHGHVIIHYNGTPDSMTTKLEGLAKVDARRVIVEPYRGMTPKVAMTAWAKLITCDTATNEDAIITLARQFIGDNKGKGPEGDIPGTPAS